MTRHGVVPPELSCGPFTFYEAERAGVTRKQLRGPNWRRMGGGLYVWAGLAESPTVALAATRRRLPVGAAFSGRTAAWLHGLDMPPCDPVEVTIPATCGVSARTGVLVHRATLSDDEIVERRSMPATSVLRTVADLASRLPPVEAVVAVDLAMHERLVDPVALHAYVANNPGRTGIARLARAIDLAEPASESAMETRLRLLLVLAGLPRPQAQVSLRDEDGHFLGRADLYYPAHRLCLEYDGGSHRDSLVEDNRRQNRILNAGFRILRFSGADVYRTPDWIAFQVRAALSVGPGRAGQR